jgi:hypothetical protein
MRLTRRKLFWVDLALLFIAVFLGNYFKRETFVLSEIYVFLLFLFFVCWWPASLTAKKFQSREYTGYWAGIIVVFKADCYLTYIISFAIVFFNLSMYSRVQVFATCVLLFLLNVLVWSVLYLFVSPEIKEPGEPEDASSGGRLRLSVNYRLLAADLGLLFFSFFAANYLKRGNFQLLPEYDQLLLIILALWLFSGLITKKYVIPADRTAYDVFWQWEKACLIMLASVAVVVYAFHLFHYSRFQGFGTVVILMITEGMLLSVVLGGRKKRELEQDIESVAVVRQILDQAPVDMDIDIEAIRRKLLSPARNKLENRLNTQAPGVMAFLEENIPDLDEILYLETALEQSSESPALQFDETMPTRLFVNLHKINDVRRLNVYFLNVHQLLLAGGYFIGYAHTIKTHHDWVFHRFPRLLAHGIYSLDFLFNRVMPKLPRINALYFVITKGKDRILSRAELLGRLSFCGFEIVAEKEMDRRFWVIARKVKKPSFNENPTYGPLVTLRRSGYQGQTISVYKLRTMHPYSEFLQDYVFKQQGLKEGGKIKDDFRVTSWGKVFRKLWIDELPMLYNWLKGDLKVVGVRPLSSHYLSLYDEELQKLRKQTKPGLIPPFYLDLPETIDEICASEKKYLQAYLEHPFKTDLYYGFWCLYNIFIKKARSG